MQAASNIGYVANNDVVQVTITLPASPSLGDIVQVSGFGAGGWKIAQNDGQSIITKVLAGNIGSIWTERDAVRHWGPVASSADGSKLFAVADQIYTSSDSGVTWTPTGPTGVWSSVASSVDGTKLIAGNSTSLYISSDSGFTWTPTGPTWVWSSVASSADGTKLVAAQMQSSYVCGAFTCTQLGYIYISLDSGVTWSRTGSSGNWHSVASSADGSKLFANRTDDYSFYTSYDSGVTWVSRSSAFDSIASSADGTKLVAAKNGNSIYTSSDSGVTWTARSPTGGTSSVASSADGTKLVAAAYGNALYTSVDSGITWTPNAHYWNLKYLASSADGTKLIASPYLGPLYTSKYIASTSIGIAGSISGIQYDSVDLQCIGNNAFMIRGYAGNLVVQ